MDTPNIKISKPLPNAPMKKQQNDERAKLNTTEYGQMESQLYGTTPQKRKSPQSDVDDDDVNVVFMNKMRKKLF